MNPTGPTFLPGNSGEYNLIKNIDPWHPVSVVITAPFNEAKKYSDAMDIVMADPYPVPNQPISLVGNAADQLKTEFEGKKPVWIVPQAFGGGELWSREPTIQETRSMTYQAIVSGATGIQYFIRHGPNSFPKSTAMWSECGKIAQEIACMTPWLLSDEVTTQATTGNQSIKLLSKVHDGQLMILAVNTINSPLRFYIRVSNPGTTSASVMFENRQVKITGNTFDDLIPAFGSQVYLIDKRKHKQGILPFRGNIVKDPGFEDISSPGVPASCYAWNEGDKGATFALDTREHLEGNNSLRIITPGENDGARLRFFPFRISGGRTYRISIMAKADSSIQNADAPIKYPACFEIGLSGMDMKRFSPGGDWREFVTFVTIPADIGSQKINVLLRVPCKGVVWFDMLQVLEATDIIKSVDPKLKDFFQND